MSSALPTRPATFPLVPLEGHALVDSGRGWKLERFGEKLLARFDPQALWEPRLGEAAWRADLTFDRESDRGGVWTGAAGRPIPKGSAAALWEVTFEGAGLGGPLTLGLEATPFKHVGIFPEQATNWRWLVERLPAHGARATSGEGPPRLLNLFGYTGVASLLAGRAGYAVTHVDASKQSLAWGRHNLGVAGLREDLVRWMCDDALAFARREVRRGTRYAAILLDPPHYGRGPKGEVWKLEEGLAPLLAACAELLAPGGDLCLSTYAVGHSPQTLATLLEGLAGAGDVVEAGELVLHEEPREGVASRVLPAGLCGRWSRA